MSGEKIADSYDVIVAGAGAGGMTAAVVAAAEGLRVLLVEKCRLAGGTTAISGGMVWMPVTSKMKEVGLSDSPEAARTYLNTVCGEENASLRDTFLAEAESAVTYLERRTAVKLRPVPLYPDYYPDLPGATAGGRVLEPLPFDGRLLGEYFARLRPPLPEFTLLGGMMVARADVPHFRRAARSPRSALRCVRLVARHVFERLSAPRGTTLHLGNALAARLLYSLIESGVDFAFDTDVLSFDQRAGGVSGVEVSRDDARARIAARRGVVLATGGFSHSHILRTALFPEQAGSLSPASEGNSGDGIRLAQEIGAAMEPGATGNAFWVPVSRFRRHDGSEDLFPHTVTDRAKPGLIAVDRAGRRFVNEAVSYHDFVLAMITPADAPRIPAYLICDRKFLWRYGLGAVRPFSLSLRRHLAGGYLVSSDTPAALARAVGIGSEGLTATLASYNEAAREGRDPAFGRGSNIYQRFLGDADHQPNPCVAPIVEPPFYALAVFPADLGTAAGLATDANANVLRRDGTPVRGLYACGNDMRSIMNGAYPGPGITLGPALTFGYLAARHMASQ
jgi:succinate dehydrogenase/fumarate reductase flavoprotein subunit